MVPSAARKLPRIKVEDIVSQWRNDGKKKLVFVDYDGTLTSISRPLKFSKPDAEVLDTLKVLTGLPDTLVYVLSGRDRTRLDAWFAGQGIGLVAEHGCFYRHPSEGEWRQLSDGYDVTWRDDVRPLFQHYMDRTPGSYIEEKEVNMTWHYLNADIEFGSWQAGQLQGNLEGILSHLPVSVSLGLGTVNAFMDPLALMHAICPQVVKGTKTLELRPASVDKATAVRMILSDICNDLKKPPDRSSSPRPEAVASKVSLILAIGDGKTDEAVFEAMNKHRCSITVTVGKKRTQATSYVDGVTEVMQLLQEVAAQVR